MFACLGCSINLPSNIRVSALDAQDIVWSRIKQGVTEQFDNFEINPDYSLTMTNLVLGDSGTYFVTATNIEGAINGPSVQLTVIKKPSESLVCLFLPHLGIHVLFLNQCALNLSTVNLMALTHIDNIPFLAFVSSIICTQYVCLYFVTSVSHQIQVLLLLLSNVITRHCKFMLAVPCNNIV